ncbi:MAG: DUF995 domain-containing protein [Rhodocyclales bacterium]|nr:DUF995 domain-containing protein [Rhodocyclales bacterium]MBI5780299.1 DUF995 domain-containing protein [Rhodocyclales bacterium]
MDMRPNTPFQSAIRFVLAVSVCFAATSALADAPAVFGDLDPLSPEKLSKEQLDQLLPGAKMSRVSATTGSTHYWTNDADGNTTVSSDNKSGIGQTLMNRTGVTAPGKWHISPDGRYCVTIEWKKIPTEDWCRYVFKTSDGYYLSKTDQNRAEKVYRFWVNGN